ncbi:hypothetical protein Taro_024207 [Colocasia esculenta]|uniref:Uncharacterized protein n=1 Tax=Colocasia esculenta TaxID=4460 RepID=A0A843UZP4_COLES|nr:hypothetical protein [Colocasia esculenta]
MSACSPFLELSEQLCYVHCGFCTTILLVSVPRTSLSKVVTVRCGHCQGLLAVDMRSVPLVPLQLLHTDGLNAPLPSAGYGENKEAAGAEEEEEEDIADAPMNTTLPRRDNVLHQLTTASSSKLKIPVLNNIHTHQHACMLASYIHGDANKRKPVGESCREEIKRIKGRDPSITHKEAFSTAAKNV